MWPTPTSRRRAIILSLALTSLLVLLTLHYDLVLAVDQASALHSQPHNPQDVYDIEMVVASTKKEDTSWLYNYVPHWRKNIYVVDNPRAPLTVPLNKGNEAMVYLTYIIDRYYTLPANILFLHASRFQWHNDDPDYDGLPALRNLRVLYLQEVGYVNLRCVWTVGCPAEIHPFDDEVGVSEGSPMTKDVYKKSFEELLPGVPVPEVVAVSCCSQFGVTRDTIWRRPRADYVRYRDWLLETPLDNSVNGRVFEFTWHIIFGKKARHCPSAQDCYCNVYGLCNMTCSEDSCGRYILPEYATLPSGWPLKGWQQEDRNFSGPL
ncbi:hypothetical protein F4779DRAFT_576134 [Xylariaceae sp. FL0662B]|nr:hypothetical protein F4779DRAFT_576134 [Xylariaceae sp. FL0662B]